MITFYIFYLFEHNRIDIVKHFDDISVYWAIHGSYMGDYRLLYVWREIMNYE